MLAVATSFISEIELEHVKEIYIEQAFLSYSIKNNISIKLRPIFLIPKKRYVQKTLKAS